MFGFQKGAAYAQIKAHVLVKFGLKMFSLYLAGEAEVRGGCETELQSIEKGKCEGTSVSLKKEDTIKVELKYF